MSDTEYRYVAARGVERTNPRRADRWVPIDDLSTLTAAELRKVADAMDGGASIALAADDTPTPQPAAPVAPDEEAANAPSVNQAESSDLGALEPPHYDVTHDEEAAAVALLRKWAADPGASGDGYIRLTPCEANHVLNALDRATAERDAASGSAAALLEREAKLNSRISDLEAQVAAKDGELFDASVACAELRAEIARLTATEDTPLGWVNIYGNGVRKDVYFHPTVDMAKQGAQSASRTVRIAVPVYERPPRATEPQVVGACVVHDGGSIAPFTYDGYERNLARYVAENGGTAHQLWLGKKIGEGGR